MAIITRVDGVKFVIQSYREQLLVKDAVILKNELIQVAQTNGKFIRLFKQPSGQVEAVFAKEAGYLFAEIIWNYFSKPGNLIYCEVLPDNSCALLVVVRQGEILVDTQLALNQLERELSASLSEDISYVIKTYGDVPLVTNSKSTYEKLANSVFSILPRDEAYKLLPLEQALQHSQFNNNSWLTWLVGVAAVLVVSVAGWYLKTENGISKIQTAFQELPTGLKLPSINDQLYELTRSINDMVIFPGWVLSEVNYHNKSVNLLMHPFGGTAFDLQQWAQLNHYNFLLTDQGAKVTSDKVLGESLLVTPVIDAQQALSQLSDRLIKILPNKSLRVGKVIFRTGYKEIAVAIRINQVSTDILDLMTKLLADLPLTLQAAVIHVNNGFLTGTIDITVIGS